MQRSVPAVPASGVQHAGPKVLLPHDARISAPGTLHSFQASGKRYITRCLAATAATAAVTDFRKRATWKRRKNPDLYQSLEQDVREDILALRKKPELLAPAGGWPQLRAAVRSGADAVYFGLDIGLNARARASNFASDDLPTVMSYLHERGVKGLVTLNTLVFDNELLAADSPALQSLSFIADAGVDAVIVQDVPKPPERPLRGQHESFTEAGLLY